MSMVMRRCATQNILPFFRKALQYTCTIQLLFFCVFALLPNAYIEGAPMSSGGTAVMKGDGLDCPDCGIDLVQVIPQGGNNLFDATDPTAGGDTVGTVGGITGTGGGISNFALITTPPGQFHASIAGQFGTCGAQTSQVAFNGSTLALRPFYGNGGQSGFVPFTVAGNIATSTASLIIPALPNDISICTVTPSNANTFTVKCIGTSSGFMCNDTWIRF